MLPSLSTPSIYHLSPKRGTWSSNRYKVRYLPRYVPKQVHCSGGSCMHLPEHHYKPHIRQCETGPSGFPMEAMSTILTASSTLRQVAFTTPSTPSSEPIPSFRIQSFTTAKMVAMYQIFGRQVGSHYVSRSLAATARCILCDSVRGTD